MNINRIIVDAQQAHREEKLIELLQKMKNETFMRSNRAGDDLISLSEILGDQCNQDNIKIILTNIAYELGRIKQICM